MIFNATDYAEFTGPYGRHEKPHERIYNINLDVDT